MSTVNFYRVDAKLPGQPALSELSLDCPESKITVVFGGKKSGKTAISRLISGLDTPNSGQIKIAGDDVNKLDPVKRKVGVIFSENSLYPTLSNYENIAFPLLVAGVRPNLRRDSIRKLASLLKISDLLTLMPEEISSLDQQKIALARALIRNPSVIVLDNPLANVDRDLRHQFVSQLQNLQSNLNLSLVYLTNDSDQALSLAHHMIFIENGKVIQTGNVKELYNRPAHLNVAKMIGNPPMNLISGGIYNGVFRGTNTRVETGEEDLLNAVIGIRPELLRYASPEEGMINATVYSVNHLNGKQLVTASLGNQIIYAPLSESLQIKIGEPIGLYAPPYEWCLFNGKSGRRIITPPISISKSNNFNSLNSNS